MAAQVAAQGGANTSSTRTETPWTTVGPKGKKKKGAATPSTAAPKKKKKKKVPTRAWNALVNATLVFFASISFVSSTVLVKAPCPDAKPAANFNWPAYKGVWYEIARYPDDWEKKGDCGVMEYDVNNPNNAFNLSNVVNGKRTSVLGTVKTEGGVLLHDSSDFTNLEGTSVIPVNIVEVDYNNYAIVYECKYDEAKKIRHDFCWIITRSRKPSDDVRSKIDNYIASSGFIDKSKLVYSHLSDEACLLK
ncbi:bilin-binding protein-like [Aricia agestis]|uniref:bilin-binding protein-like n=1 Tax=Aricia agestis TaxID=91739 RepID=UPI001C208A61|nr:bilin-binding protein-like [Aricia agestis]